jgi:hypothetical protein
MFQDILKAVQDEFNRLSKERPKGDKETGSYTRELYRLRAQLEAALENITISLDNLQRAVTEVPRQLAISMRDSSKANKILVKNLRKAIKLNREFDTPAFSDNLMSACLDINTIFISYVGGVFNVEIRLNDTAGSVEDYANAVKAVRAEIASENGTKTPAAASMIWKNMLYIPAREGGSVKKRIYSPHRRRSKVVDVTEDSVAYYWGTISRRMAMSGKLAPYWEILDKGSFVMEGSGGTPYPENMPTNFVGNTILEVSQLLSEQAGIKVSSIRDQIRLLASERAQIESALAKISFEMEKVIYGGPTSLEIPNAEHKIQQFMSKVGDWERAHGVKASRAKIEQVMRALRSADISELGVTAAGRIELTAPGSSVRFRPFISDIISGFEI